MSWESYTLMRCKNCGKIYEVEDSTLIMKLDMNGWADISQMKCLRFVKMIL